MLKIRLQGKDERNYERGILALDVAKDISEGLARSVVGAKINGKVCDLMTPLTDDCDIEFLKFADKDGKMVFWHTSTHIMAQAVKRLYPNAKLGTGPALDNGFYYDIDLEEKFTVEDLEKIEKEMKNIVSESLDIVRKEVSRNEAIEIMKSRNEDYKIEIINGLPEDATISLYQQGEFIDLCAGPHLPNTKYVKAFKLTSIAGAYWRADANNKQLQRLYGISFEKKKELDEYLKLLEEAKLRDHRKLGKELDLFSMHEEGPGFPFFHPKGMVLRNTLEKFWREEHEKAGYDEIKTPIILNEALWHQSGHWDHYKENMYFTKIDGEDYAIKPMNCPGSILTYKTHLFSYRDLPLRWAEMGQVHRHELSGALHGLMRVRAFTQDDAHVFCTKEQIEEQIIEIIDLYDKFYTLFGFEYHIELSTKPDKAIGSDEIWEMAEANLKSALEHKGIDYKLNPGDGAFYGPKIDFKMKDSIGRIWQCGTIQLDFNLPQRFEMSYIGADGEKHEPVMIHRAMYGSLERFLGILIEHYAGAFPIWLAPVQARILTISDEQVPFAKEVFKKLQEAGIRVEIDTRVEKIGYKIREANGDQKIPVQLIIGKNEVANNEVNVRRFGSQDSQNVSVDEIVNILIEESKVPFEK